MGGMQAREGREEQKGKGKQSSITYAKGMGELGAKGLYHPPLPCPKARVK